MKKKLFCFSIVLLTVYIVCFPADAVEAAGNGLSLWYERVLPTLLPCSILSNILIASNYMEVLTKYLFPAVRLFLPVSEAGSFIVCTGFFFGFPMGSKNCAELFKEGKITLSEAKLLFAISNNISPVFIGSYILTQQLCLSGMFGISLALLYGPPLLTGCLLLRKNARRASRKNPASGFQMNFKIIDAGIMNGFETLAKIGGYIMLFSIAISAVSILPLPEALRVALVNALELTNGIAALAGTSWDIRVKYVFAMTATAFGGLSGLAQTSSMCKGTPLSMKDYLGWRLFFSLATLLLSVPAAWYLFD